jgi:hypothetical protein
MSRGTRGNNPDGHEAAPMRALSGHIDDWEDVAIDYLDDHVDDNTKAAVELHLRECSVCAARLQTQQNVFALLKQTPLADPPSGLEDRVLGELSFTPKPAVRAIARPQAHEPSRWSTIWTRRAMRWVPATVGIAAVLVAVVAYGLVGSHGGNSASVTTASASAREQMAADNAGAAATSGGAAINPEAAALTTAAATETTTGPTDTTMAPLVGVTGAGDSVGSSSTTVTAKYYPDATQEAATMVADLQTAAGPVYFVFEGTGLDGPGAAETAASVVDQINLATGLVPLDGTLSLGGPTFAAYLLRVDATQLVDTLWSIAASLKLTVSLGTRPPDAFAEPAALLTDEAELPALSADSTASIKQWRITPLDADSQPAVTGAGTSDDAGTRVLVVIYVKN